MAATLSTDLGASLAWVFQEDRDLSSVIDSSRLEYVASLANGTGADQADVLWHDERTVAATSNDDLDLTNLSSPLFGSTVTFSLVTVKAILITNTETAPPAVLRVGGAGAVAGAFGAPFAGDQDAVVEVPLDSGLLLSNKSSGWAVVNGSSDLLRIANPGAAAITYRIAILGTTA